MRLYEIAIRNLVRRRGRAMFLLAGLLIGISTVVAIEAYTEAMTGDINKKMEEFGANILITPRSEHLTLTYGGITLGNLAIAPEDIPESDLQRIHQIKNASSIAGIGPMAIGAVSAGGRRVLLAGVDFEAVPILKPWWKPRGTMPGASDLLLGAEAARLLDAAPGAELTIDSLRFRVSGVLEPTGSQDDQLVFAHLKTAQRILGKESFVTLVEVAALCQACPVEEMVAQLSDALPEVRVSAVQQIVSSRMQTMHHLKSLSLGLSSVVLLIGGLMVWVTLMNSVRERTREIGIFRAIGFRRRHIMQIILLEAALISTCAGILGYIMGSAVAWGAVRHLSGDGITVNLLNPELILMAPALALAIGLASAFYPSLQASRLEPGEALRTL